MDNSGTWKPEPVGESTLARVTCNVDKESKYLTCGGELDLKKDDDAGRFDSALTYTGRWVKDLADCDKCED